MKRNFSESHIEPLIFRLNNPKNSAVEKAQRDIFSNWIKNLDLPKNSTALSVSIGDRVWDYLTFMEKKYQKDCGNRYC